LIEGNQNHSGACTDEVHLGEDVRKIVTTETKLLKMVKGYERALPYLEKGGYDGDQIWALVRKMLKVLYFLVVLPY